jgi:hypothetical protein
VDQQAPRPTGAASAISRVTCLTEVDRLRFARIPKTRMGLTPPFHISWRSFSDLLLEHAVAFSGGTTASVAESDPHDSRSHEGLSQDGGLAGTGARCAVPGCGSFRRRWRLPRTGH